MVGPNLRASSTKRARKAEVFDKMTTVRGVTRDTGGQLKQAIAESIASRAEGTRMMDKIREKLVSQERQTPRKKK